MRLLHTWLETSRRGTLGPMDTQALSDIQDRADALEKKLHNNPILAGGGPAIRSTLIELSAMVRDLAKAVVSSERE